MAIPTKYTRDYSFTGHESASPGTPPPGGQMDNEFDGVADSIDEIVDALGSVRRSDGELKTDSVGFDQLKPEVDAAFQAIPEFETRVGAVESAVASAISVNTAQNGRLNAVETKNTQQDNQFTVIQGVIDNDAALVADVVAGQNAQDVRIGHAEAVDAQQNQRIYTTELLDIEQNRRLTAFEASAPINEPVDGNADNLFVLPVDVAPAGPDPDNTPLALGTFIRDIYTLRSRGVVTGVVSQAQAELNAAIIERCIARANLGYYDRKIVFPKGLVQVHLNQSLFVDDDINNPRYMAIWMTASHIHIEGQGREASILQCWHDQTMGYSYGPLLWTVPPTSNGEPDNTNVYLGGLTIDGNNFYAKPENAPADLNTHIERAASGMSMEGMQDCLLENLMMLNVGAYGMGMQNGTYIRNTVRDVEIYNSLGDGIDMKDDRSLGEGNLFDDVRVKRFGLSYMPSDPYAGIDVNSRGTTIRDCKVTEWGPLGTIEAGIRFKQGFYLAGRGYGGQKGLITGCHIICDGPSVQRGSNPDGSIGIMIKSDDATVRDCWIGGPDGGSGGPGIGIKVSQPDVRLFNNTIEAQTVGIYQSIKTGESEPFDGGDNLLIDTAKIKVNGNSLGIGGVGGTGILLTGTLRGPMKNVDIDVPAGVSWRQASNVPVATENVRIISGSVPSALSYRLDATLRTTLSPEISDWASYAPDNAKPSLKALLACDEFYQDCIADGTWSLLERFYVHRAGLLGLGCVNLRRPKQPPLGVSGAVVALRRRGMQADGDTGNLVSPAGAFDMGSATLTNFGFGYWLDTPTTITEHDSVELYLGTGRIQRGTTNASMVARCGDSTPTGDIALTTPASGLRAGERTGNTRNFYENGVLKLSDTVTPTSLPTTFSVGGINSDGSSAVIGCSYLTRYQGSTRHPRLYAAIAKLMAALA